MTLANLPPMDPGDFVNNDDLARQAAAQAQVYGAFVAAGMPFVVKALGWMDVASLLSRLNGSGSTDHQHGNALGEGYLYLYRLAAVGGDGRVYAVWEIYSKEVGSLSSSKSRTIQVDVAWTGHGIGTALARAVRARFPVEWSGLFTPAGARLKDRLEDA